MLDERRPIKVFLCHAHIDKYVVRDLYLRLSRDGVDAWLDKEKLLPGQDWEYEIPKAVRESDVVVVCLSKQFNEAGFRQKEVRLALDTAMEKPEGEIFIIPARLEECETLPSLRRWHWVDLFENDGYERLIGALKERAKKIRVSLGSDDADGLRSIGIDPKHLESEAIQHELKGEFWDALQSWYLIKRMAPTWPRVDIKIRQLEGDIPKVQSLEDLVREAQTYEMRGEYRDALEAYYKIKSIAPSWPSVHKKIMQLERKVRPYPGSPSRPLPRYATRRACFFQLIMGFVVVALALLGGYFIYPQFFIHPAEPTRTPTRTQSFSSTTPTGTPCFDEPADLSLDFGQVVTHTICPEGDTDTFKFSGTSGERISIKVTYKSGNMRPCVELIAPDNTRTEACENAFNNEIDMTLNQTGSYTIVVDVRFLGIGDYTLVVERF
jgi:hypothetical protein